jgi:hypothetical protein
MTKVFPSGREGIHAVSKRRQDFNITATSYTLYSQAYFHLHRVRYNAATRRTRIEIRGESANAASSNYMNVIMSGEQG